MASRVTAGIYQTACPVFYVRWLEISNKTANRSLVIMWGVIYNFALGTATPEQKRIVWQVFITLLLIAHISLAGGWFPGASSGYAASNEVKQVQLTLIMVQSNQLLDGVEQERRHVCRHIRANNAEALKYAVRRRDEMIRSYETITGKEVQDVTCEELGLPSEDDLGIE